jgi:hypothetical protein
MQEILLVKFRASDFLLTYKIFNKYKKDNYKFEYGLEGGDKIIFAREIKL